MKIALMIVGFVIFGGWSLLVTGFILTHGAILFLSPFMFSIYYIPLAIAAFLYWKMGAPQKADQGLDK